MKTETTRLCVYPKDVQRITGKSERYGRMLLINIRERFNKEAHQLVSIQDFCNYTGLKRDEVQALLIG